MSCLHEPERPASVSVAIIGCGKLGTALLRGFLAQHSLPSAASATPFPPVHVSRIVVTVRQQADADRLLKQVSDLGPTRVTVKLHAYNAQAIIESHVVIIGCKPRSVASLLCDAAIREALSEGHTSKILISMVGGVPISQLRSCLNATGAQEDSSTWCPIVRVIPNIAACLQQSMTIVSKSPGPEDNEAVTQASSLFAQLGLVMQLPESQFNNASALASSAIAFYTNLIVFAAAGVTGDDVEDRLSPEDALSISAQAAHGASSLIVDGKLPQLILDQVATKGGSTMAGLKVMDDLKVRDALRTTVLKCAKATARLSDSAEL